MQLSCQEVREWEGSGWSSVDLGLAEGERRLMSADLWLTWGLMENGWVGVTERPIGATPSPPQRHCPLAYISSVSAYPRVPSDTAYGPKLLARSRDPVTSRNIQHARFQSGGRGRATRRQENPGRE